MLKARLYVKKFKAQLVKIKNCHNPNNNTTQPQHNLNTVVVLDMKMTVENPPQSTTHHTNSMVVFRSFRLTFIDHN